MLKHKSETFDVFKVFRALVENQTGKQIITLRFDRGGEYMSGVSERRNRTLMEMVRSMMSYSLLPLFFWGYVLETAAYIMNNFHLKWFVVLLMNDGLIVK